MVKRITLSFAIILICFVTFLTGYTYVYPSYADTTTNQWTSVTTNQELADAFRYYCKSRNLAIEGSVLDALTTFTTNSFNTICNTLGIDSTALQAHLKRSTDSNGKVQFLFDQFGVTAYNRIFSEFLQNNNLAVGDNVPETNLYNGKYYNGYLITIYSGLNSVSQQGSSYQYTSESLNTFFTNHNSNETIPFLLPNGSSWMQTYIFKTTASGGQTRWYFYIGSSPSSNRSFYIYYSGETYGYETGYPSLGYNTTDNKFYLGGLCHNQGNLQYRQWTEVTDISPTNATIYYTTNNNTINTNTYNDNKQTVINNEGDVYNYDYDDEDPPINPGAGGSGGGSDGDITFPDFNFDIPDLDWSLGDLSEKFPFSIPFDLLAFFTVLNAEPVAPSIDAYIPLGSWYTWHFQADFSQFNNWATIIRNVEFIAFCIGLIYLTIRLVKG